MTEIEKLFFSLALLLLPFALVRLEGKRDLFKELFLTRLKPKRSLLNGLELFAKTFVVLLLLGVALQALGLLDTYKVIEVVRAQPLAVLLLAVTLAPIGEELLFRGYLQHRVGIVFSSALFAWLHMGYGSVTEVLAAFLASMVWGYSMRKNKDLYACMLAHALYNLFSISVALSL